MDENRLNGLNQAEVNQKGPKQTKLDRIRKNKAKWTEQAECIEVDQYRLNKPKWTKWIKVD